MFRINYNPMLNFGAIERHIVDWYAAAKASAKSKVPKVEKVLQQLTRWQDRAMRREQRHASWPYCGARHRARIQRQIDRGQLTAANGVCLEALPSWSTIVKI